MHVAFQRQPQRSRRLALPLAVAAVLLGGCSMTESRVRQQIIESEARTAAAQAQLEERLTAAQARLEEGMVERFTRTDQALAAATEQMRREIESQMEGQRRLVVDIVVRQRDSLAAQVRAMDEAISTLAMPKARASPIRAMP